jgi:hypothetical protein
MNNKNKFRQSSQDIQQTNRMTANARKIQGKVLFIGPTDEGSDKEYVKVLSGTVNDHKPSFA